MQAPVDFDGVLRALNEAEVRYVIVGGLAVVLHGVDRLTADIDLVIDLEPGAVKEFLRVMDILGYRARIPVDPEGFSDPETRRQWIEEKGMRVLSFWDPSNRHPVVDVFSESPIEFERLWSDSEIMDIAGMGCRVASKAHLIEIKQKAGRERDHSDIERLTSLGGKRQND